MKPLSRIIALFLSLVVCLPCMTISTAAADDLIMNTHEELPLFNALANVQRVGGDDAETLLASENAPGIVLCDAAELADMQTFLTLCMNNNAIPVLQVDTLDTAEALVEAVSAVSCKDLTAISADPAVLARIRNRKTLVRTGLIITPEADTLTSKEANAIREAVRSAPATFCVLPSDNVSRQAVSELQELAVAVWVDVDDEAGSSDFAVQTAKALTSGANGIITASAADTAAFANDWFAYHTMTRTPVMIGHRGNPSQAPENSLSGFIAAYENGADIFEVDVEITKDGEIIIMHDSTINRTTNYTGNKTVNEMTLTEIRQYFLLDNDGKVSDEKVPTLREVLEEFRDKDCRIFVEFKGYNADNVPKTAEIIKELDMQDRVDVISFNANFLTSTQKELPGMSTGYLQSPSGAASNQKQALRVFFSSVVYTQGANSTINPNKSAATREYLQVATDRGMTIWPWTYALATNNQAFLLCPDGVTTDDMQWVTSMFKSFNADKTAVTATANRPVEILLQGVTYGDEAIIPDGDQLVLSVIDGDDCVAIEDGELVATDSGTAYILVGCKTQTTDGSEYVLYTEPIAVTVHLIHPVWWIVMGAVVVLAAAAVILSVRKRRRSKQPQA